MGIFSTYIDRSGVLWVGTFAAGLNKWDRKKRRFNTIEFDPRINFENSQNSIYEDQAGRILVGTDEGLVQLSGEQKGSPTYPYSHGRGHGKNLYH